MKLTKNMKIIIAICIAIIMYGFFEKYRKEKLYEDFKSYQPISCDGTIVLKSRGWRIHNNRFFTNGKIIKTIVFCKSVNN